jgi:hypothetical protein
LVSGLDWHKKKGGSYSCRRLSPGHAHVRMERERSNVGRLATTLGAKTATRGRPPGQSRLSKRDDSGRGEEGRGSKGPAAAREKKDGRYPALGCVALACAAAVATATMILCATCKSSRPSLVRSRRGIIIDASPRHKRHLPRIARYGTARPQVCTSSMYILTLLYSGSKRICSFSAPFCTDRPCLAGYARGEHSPFTTHSPWQLCRGTALHSAAVREDLERESSVSRLVCPLSGDPEAVEAFPTCPPFPALRAWRIWEQRRVARRVGAILSCSI